MLAAGSVLSAVQADRTGVKRVGEGLEELLQLSERQKTNLAQTWYSRGTWRAMGVRVSLAASL